MAEQAPDSASTLASEHPQPDREVAAVFILAAGSGTRMKSQTSKLLHRVAGRSLVSHAVRSGEAVSPRRLIAVVGKLREQVEAHLAEVAPEVSVVAQSDDGYGTGFAVRCAMAALDGEGSAEVSGEIVVIGGDVPMLTADTMRQLLSHHRDQQAAVTILTARVSDPARYGRIVRDDAGEVESIVEHRDATPAQLGIDEINSSTYVFDPAMLRAGLAQLTDDNAAGEYLLTDVIGFARAQGQRVSAWLSDDPWQAEGVNDRVQLAAVHAELNRRILHYWMLAGVTILDPATTWIHDEVELSEDVTILPGTSLEGATVVASGAIIGPDTTLIDCEVGPGAQVMRSHAQLAVIGPDASVGPFSYLRPGTEMGSQSKLGAFVEAKNTKLAARAKASHLSYLGDGIVGEGSNIGAGVIFANYDGVSKAATRIGKECFVGSDSTLIAPVQLADGVYVAAGSTITQEVGPGELAVARGQQRNINGWVARRRPGSPSARAAENASARAAENTQRPAPPAEPGYDQSTAAQ